MSGYIGKNNVQVTEANANARPSFDTLTKNFTVNVGSNIDYTPVVSDPDKLLHSFFLTGAVPTEFACDSATGRITASPVLTAGAISFTLNVTDGPNTVQQTINIASSSAVVAYSNLGSAFTNQSYTITPTISNPNNLTLTFSVADGSGFTINSTTGVLSGIPASLGAQSISVNVSDQYGNSQAFSITYTGTLGPLASFPNATVINGGYGVLYQSGGTFTFNKPSGVRYVSAVAVGTGGGGVYSYSGSCTGGAGGGLGWRKNIDLNTTNTVSVTVGGGGGQASSGATSSFGAFCSGSGGQGGSSSNTGGNFNGEGGGAGGNSVDPGGYNQSGGGGGGGYSGKGGNGQQGSGTDGAGGGGGGGAGGHWARGAGGGGTGVSFTCLAGPNGVGGVTSSTHNTGVQNSAGTFGTSNIGASDGTHSANGAHGGQGGGGGGGGQTNYGATPGNGGTGYVAIFWTADGSTI